MKLQGQGGAGKLTTVAALLEHGLGKRSSRENAQRARHLPSGLQSSFKARKRFHAHRLGSKPWAGQWLHKRQMLNVAYAPSDKWPAQLVKY